MNLPLGQPGVGPMNPQIVYPQAAYAQPTMAMPPQSRGKSHVSFMPSASTIFTLLIEFAPEIIIGILVIWILMDPSGLFKFVESIITWVSKLALELFGDLAKQLYNAIVVPIYNATIGNLVNSFKNMFKI